MQEIRRISQRPSLRSRVHSELHLQSGEGLSITAMLEQGGVGVREQDCCGDKGVPQDPVSSNTDITAVVSIVS